MLLGFDSMPSCFFYTTEKTFVSFYFNILSCATVIMFNIVANTKMNPSYSCTVNACDEPNTLVIRYAILFVTHAKTVQTPVGSCCCMRNLIEVHVKKPLDSDRFIVIKRVRAK